MDRAREIDLPPYWRIRSAVGEPDANPDSELSGLIRLHRGDAFGDGNHPTTQLCLLAIGHLLRIGGAPELALDYGAGNGILAIGLARAGSRVQAVEIDDEATAEAQRNLRLNGVQAQVTFSQRIAAEPQSMDLAVANIIAPVLLESAGRLCTVVSPRGRLLLSGLTSTDVPSILSQYRPLLPTMEAEVYERGEWRAVLFSPG